MAAIYRSRSRRSHDHSACKPLRSSFKDARQTSWLHLAPRTTPDAGPCCISLSLRLLVRPYSLPPAAVICLCLSSRRCLSFSNRPVSTGLPPELRPSGLLCDSFAPTPGFDRSTIASPLLFASLFFFIICLDRFRYHHVTSELDKRLSGCFIAVCHCRPVILGTQ